MHSDVLIIGAGMVGAASAYYIARAGLSVTVLDRGSVASGTTGAGEGNLLVSDKEPGPELDLMLLSRRLWRELADQADGAFEYEAKGGLMVAADTVGELGELAARQAKAGVETTPVAPDELTGYEPWLNPELAGGMFYPQDAQIQPMLAAAHMLRAARVKVETGVTVTGLIRSGGSVVGARTTEGDFGAGAVLNATGVWAAQTAQMAGVDLPIQPRRGFVLVTEPLPKVINHKVYSAEYLADIASAAPGLESSAVVEGTKAGTILIGASRERAGFDRRMPVPVLRRLAAQAIALFPKLADVSVIRTYCGFRPYSPDHLPLIGTDPRITGLLHACGHEGAGIGLATGTGYLLAQVLTDARPDLDLAPFDPGRFAS